MISIFISSLQQSYTKPNYPFSMLFAVDHYERDACSQHSKFVPFCLT